MKSKTDSVKSKTKRTERVAPVRVQPVVRVRHRPMLAAFRKCVMAMQGLNMEERRRAINATSVAVGLKAIHLPAHPNDQSSATRLGGKE